MKKYLFPIITIIICFAVVGTTFAWLMDSTDPIVNTFTIGKVDITLAETTGNQYKMIPGSTIAKDPKVTVEAGSEACWVFVKLEKINNFDSYMTYDMAEGWTPLDGANGVYYRAVDADTANEGAEFGVLKDNQVTVKETVTKDVTDTPKLTFTAYAIQSENFADVVKAWNAFPNT